MSEPHVPAPQPAHSDYLVGAHYFPGWKAGTHTGWAALDGKYPERTPLLGYYDEENPEVTDWEIKWALEHGISYFVYCWYRDARKLDQPMSDHTHRLGHAIHDGLFRARYGSQMKFAIMWETQGGIATSEADLIDNLLPYWIDTYFARPNYLVLGRKPILFVYYHGGMRKIMAPLGGEENAPRIFDRMRQAAAKRGFDGLTIGMEYRGQSPADFAKMKTWGFDFTFSYCWHTPQQHPTPQEAIDHQAACLAALRKDCPLPYTVTATVGWDPAPWSHDDPNARSPWLYRPKITQWKLTPDEWKQVLVNTKAFMDAEPSSSLARRMVLLDNWNEWSEGHYLSPQVTDKFGYLQAVREVFTHKDNRPDYRLPQELGLGPYDKGYRSILRNGPAR